MQGGTEVLSLCADVPSQSLHVQASDTSGTFSVIKAADNSGKSLPGGTSNKKLSAAQLANAQQVIKQANEMAATTNYTGPIVTGSGDDYTQACANTLHASVCNARSDLQEGNPSQPLESSQPTAGHTKGYQTTNRLFCQLPSHAISCSMASLQQWPDRACIGSTCWGNRLRLPRAQVLIHPKTKQKNTVEQVNSNAPVYTVPGVRSPNPCATLKRNACDTPCAIPGSHACSIYPERYSCPLQHRRDSDPSTDGCRPGLNTSYGVTHDGT